LAACPTVVTWGQFHQHAMYLRIAFTRADPESVRIQLSPKYFLCFWDLPAQKLLEERWWNRHLVSISSTFCWHLKGLLLNNCSTDRKPNLVEAWGNPLPSNMTGQVTHSGLQLLIWYLQFNLTYFYRKCHHLKLF